MRIWSDRLTVMDLYEAAPPGVDVHHEGRVKARLRDWRFDRVRLSTEHGNRWPNSGAYGGGREAYECGHVASPRAATYDEHGWWMAELFRRDPEAIIDGLQRYDGEAGFHEATDGRYAQQARIHRPTLADRNIGREHADPATFAEVVA